MAELKVNCEKVDTAFFLQQWEKYRKVMSRTHPQAINDKLFMLARQALWRTEKADKKDISKTLGKISYLNTRGGERRYRHRLTKAAKKGMENVPLIALIINKRAKPGEGLHGAAMRQAIQQVIGARMISIAYIKSGWLPAIQALAQVSSIRAPNVRDDKAAQQIGKPKGRATIAKAGNIITGMIANEAYARRDQKQAFQRVGGKGLDLAFAAEAKEMQSYIAKKTKPPADDFNRSQK